MKRLLCFILILVMAFGSTAPVYAEAWSSQQAATVTATVNSIAGFLANFSTHFTDWVGVGANTSGMTSTWNQFYTRWLVFQTDFNNMVSWLVPSGPNSSNTATMLDSIIVLTNYAMNHLPDISVIAGYVSSWMTSNNNHLSALETALTRLPAKTSYTIAELQKNAQQYLNWNTPGNANTGLLNLLNINTNGNLTNRQFYWQAGSPLGNIALYLENINQNFARGWSISDNKFFPHYNDQLSTWDSQGDTLEQVLFTPESAIQGLYRYLAFVQRDVARMTFIIADPHEQAGMENANESGVADMYADVYDSDNGGVTLSDMSDTFNTQKVAKQTFNTGVQFSTNGLFSFTDDGNWGFWSNAVKNDMDNVPMTRKSDSFDSTAYDNQLEVLYSIWGIKDGK